MGNRDLSDPVDDRFAYLSRWSCGCAVAVMVDSPDHVRDTAKFVAEEIRAGATVTRLPILDAQEAFRGAKWPCEHELAKRGAKAVDPNQAVLAL